MFSDKCNNKIIPKLKRNQALLCNNDSYINSPVDTLYAHTVLKLAFS